MMNNYIQNIIYCIGNSWCQNPVAITTIIWSRHKANWLPLDVCFCLGCFLFVLGGGGWLLGVFLGGGSFPTVNSGIMNKKTIIL